MVLIAKQSTYPVVLIAKLLLYQTVDKIYTYIIARHKYNEIRCLGLKIGGVYSKEVYISSGPYIGVYSHYRLQLKRVKGGGPGEKLCYCPANSPDNQFFRPTGIYIIRTVKGKLLKST